MKKFDKNTLCTAGLIIAVASFIALGLSLIARLSQWWIPLIAMAVGMVLMTKNITEKKPPL